ncbi:MAG: T9SS type A sorting domain-containing protein [Sphingobacteriales bacterium]|nr:T9SS type A sorting domain-containing protein [Sphingobacteriales bacterium]
MYNSTGQIVYKSTLNNHQNTCSIDTQQLTNGLYMVQISNGQTNSVAKIVK